MSNSAMKTLAKWSVNDYHQMIAVGILRDRHPTPNDIFWLIEVAKTSLKKDLEFKATIYASAGIGEYWVLDLFAKQMTVFRNPENGNYTSKQVMKEGAIASLAFPDVPISVTRLLG